MNWVDGVLLVILLAMVIVGSKKGLIRELMAFVVFFAAIIISVSYVDVFAVWVYEQVGGSPLISAFLAFIILLAGSYVAFKLIGMLFYKVAQIKSSGKRDQMGGALVGFLRGWATIGFVTMMTFLLPMPDGFYSAFEESFLGSTVAKTVPLMYKSSEPVRPNKNTFVEQIENTLIHMPREMNDGSSDSDERAEVFTVMYQIDRFFDIDHTDRI